MRIIQFNEYRGKIGVICMFTEILLGKILERILMIQLTKCLNHCRRIAFVKVVELRPPNLLTKTIIDILPIIGIMKFSYNCHHMIGSLGIHLGTNYCFYKTIWVSKIKMIPNIYFLSKHDKVIAKDTRLRLI